MTATATETLIGELRELPLDQLHPSADNPRRDVGDVVELATSIRSMGILEPLIVTPNGDGYIVVAGHRRLAAAELAAIETVPCVVRDFDDQERLAAMLVENLQRTDLSPLEEGAAYRRLIDEFKYSQRDLAEKVGRSQGHISKRVALLDLPEDVRKKVDSGGITLADAVELAKLKAHPARLRAATQVRGLWETIPMRVEAQLRELENDKLLTAREEELESQATPTVRVPSEWNLPRGVHGLKGGVGSSSHQLAITAKDHEQYGCHAIALYLAGESIVEFPVCVDRTQHPKIKTGQERTSQGANTRATQVDRDREALKEAEERRLAFLGQLMNGKLAKQEMIDFCIAHFVNRTDNDGDEALENALYALGLVDEETKAPVRGKLKAYAQQSPTHLLRAAFAAALADFDGYELSIWNTWGEAEANYLELLERHGYVITPAERKRLPKPSKKAA